MGFRTTSLGALAVLAVALGALAALDARRPEPAAPFAVLPPGADVVAIEIDLEGTMRIERVTGVDGPGWRVVVPVELPADPGVVDAMLAALDLARPRNVVRADPDRPEARFGLAPPRGRAVLEIAGRRPVVLEIGAPAAEGRGTWVRLASRPGTVALIDDAIVRSLRRRPEDLRDRRLWVAAADELAAVEVHDGAHDVRLERRGGAFHATPPGALADFERASRAFDLLASPRAVGFPAVAACGPRPAARLIAETTDGARREIAFVAVACPDCPGGSVPACVADAVVAVAADLRRDAADLAAGVARAPLFGPFDPDAVVAIDVSAPAGPWSLRRTADGWDGEGAPVAPAPEAVARYLRRLAGIEVDPVAVAPAGFEAAGAIALRWRGGASVRIERSAAAADGTVAVRREGEAVAFRIGAAESYLVLAPLVHVGAPGDGACDPLGVAEIDVVAGDGTPVQVLRRAGGGSWSFAGSSLPVDAAAADLLVGDLCRLRRAPRIATIVEASEAAWRVTLRDRDGGEVSAVRVGGPAAGADGRAAAVAGEADARLLPAAAVERLRRPLAAPGALDVPRAAGLTIDVASASGAMIRLAWDGERWSGPAGVPEAIAASAGSALAAPEIRGAVAVGASDDPSGAWPLRFRVERRPAGEEPSVLAIGGPGEGGGALAWDERRGALLEVAPALLGELALLERLAAP